MERNYNIDSVRMLSSFAVVFMHVVNYLPTTAYANYWTYDWYFPILDLAVPSFFVFSGYFLSRKDYKEIPAYACRILVMLVAYNIVYLLIKLPKEIITLVVQGELNLERVWTYLASLNLADFLIGIIGSEHLWFLSALFYAAWILYFLKRQQLSAGWCFVVGIAFFVLVLIMPETPFISRIFLYGGFAKGFFYLAMGNWLAKKEIRYPAKKFGLGLSFIFLIRVASNVDSLFILEVLLAITVFHIMEVLKDNPGQANILSRTAHYSIGIYTLHIIFTGLFTVARELNPALNSMNPIILVPVVFVLCIAGSVLLFPYTERYIHQPLINLFNRLMVRLDYSIYIKPSAF